MEQNYLLKEELPLFWCSGCGNGIALGSLLRSMDSLHYKKENTVVVTGIGCWGKADDYINTNRFHGTHGRALPFSTGIKLANPDLKVITLMGDGDGTTIGGNHLIHAARRNIDVTAIIVNNHNYGMTGGQYSGTTLRNSKTKTSPYGHIEDSFDICELISAAGATFVARGTVYDIFALDKIIKKALKHKGFSLVEIVAQCPTHYGRLNQMPKPVDMMKWIKEQTVSKAKAANMTQEELKGKFITGVFTDIEKEDYSTAYQRIIDGLREEGNQ